jgi:hypothetical protein
MGLARRGRGSYFEQMPAMWSKTLAVAVVAVLAMGDAGAQYDSAGTPSIMRDGDGGISIMRDENAPKQKGGSKETATPRKVPRGSSTYIPPPVPSPNTGRAIVAPTPRVYTPPPINSFGDRVTGCIHSYPLNAGTGNNPTDQQSYIRQCAN